MAKTRLSGAAYVERGYGQVEPNHLSAQRNGQIYAQLPAAAAINVLENGQFVKYDYANEAVNFTGPGEWMLVFNEVKLYRDGLDYNDFAMKKEDYVARVYSPIDGTNPTQANSRNYSSAATTSANSAYAASPYASVQNNMKATGGVSAEDPFEPDSTDNPFVIEQFTRPKYMPNGTTMVPRVFKTMPGDIMTINTVNVAATDITLGMNLYVGDNGYLVDTKKTSANANGAVSGDMVWQVVKIYTLADRQRAVKIMRIA